MKSLATFTKIADADCTPMIDFVILKKSGRQFF
jgi:hypothetical protein